MSAASGDTVLDDGTAIGHRVIGELLLARGADVNLQHAGHGFTALMYAAFQPGTMDMLRLLLAAGARLDLRDNDGFTALQLAEAEGNAEGARMIRRVRAQRPWVRVHRHACVVGKLAITIVRWCNEVVEAHNRPDGRGAALAEAEFLEAARG
jgi:hypothetical protein